MRTIIIITKVRQRLDKLSKVSYVNQFTFIQQGAVNHENHMFCVFTPTEAQIIDARLTELETQYRTQYPQVCATYDVTCHTYEIWPCVKDWLARRNRIVIL